MPGEAMAKAAGAVADPELAEKVAALKKKQRDDQRDEQEHELTEVERLKVENINLKIAALRVQIRAHEVELVAVQKAVCSRLGFAEDDLIQLNPEKMTVRRSPKKEEPQ